MLLFRPKWWRYYKTIRIYAVKTLLYHIVQGRYGSAEIQSWGANGTATTALGNDIHTRGSQPLLINNHASVIVSDLEASNGVIHVINGVLNPNHNSSPATPQPPAQNNSDPAAPAQPAWDSNSESTQQPAGPPTPVPSPTPIPTPTKPPWWVDPQESTGATIGSPNENPAYVGGGVQDYRFAIMADASFCKGMTWTVLQQTNNATRVGADRKTNPYRGDAACNEMHSLLCIHQDFRGAPSAAMLGSWANGVVQATVPIPGTRLRELRMANSICANTFGHEYRMAEFHDGNKHGLASEEDGWSFWASGNLNLGERYWVRISDQAANPWNSTNPAPPPKLNTWVTQVRWPGGDPAFQGGGRVMPAQDYAPFATLAWA